MEGRWTRSSLSTWMIRSPWGAYAWRSARTSDDFPVPRDPHRRMLFAGRPARNCRVFSSTTLFCSSIPSRSERWRVSTFPIGSRYPEKERFRQFAATHSVQSIRGTGRGSSVSREESTRFSCAVSSGSGSMSTPVVGVFLSTRGHPREERGHPYEFLSERGQFLPKGRVERHPPPLRDRGEPVPGARDRAGDRPRRVRVAPPVHRFHDAILEVVRGEEGVEHRPKRVHHVGGRFTIIPLEAELRVSRGQILRRGAQVPRRRSEKAPLDHLSHGHTRRVR